MKLLVTALVVVLGVAASVYGGRDDSPGLQLVGAVLVAVAVLTRLRDVRRTRSLTRAR